MRKFIWLLVVLYSVTILCACGKKDTEPSTEDITAESTVKPSSNISTTEPQSEVPQEDPIEFTPPIQEIPGLYVGNDMTVEMAYYTLNKDSGSNFLTYEDYDFSWLVTQFCEGTYRVDSDVVYISTSVEDAVNTSDMRWSVGLVDGTAYEVDTDYQGNITQILDETDEGMLYYFERNRIDVDGIQSR